MNLKMMDKYFRVGDKHTNKYGGGPVWYDWIVDIHQSSGD